MIQCSVCEDWYHSKHLGNPPPPEYEEMVCDDCMRRNSFLRVYESSRQVHIDVDVETVDVEKQETNRKEEKKDGSKEEGDKRILKEKCLLQDKFSPSVVENSGAAYFLDNWRASLCRCSLCKDLYSASKVEFLLDATDTVTAYESQSRPSKCTSSLQSGMEAFRNNLDHVQQVEALHQYGELSSELKEYFKSFVDNDRVVRREDIENFFESMTRKKRRKIEEGLEGMPSTHCHY
jgi:E3 ubiquitin-protein ligase UBR7